MGIPFLFSQLFKAKGGKTNKAIVRKLPQKVSSLSLDANSIIHEAYAVVYGYGSYRDDEVKKYVSTLSETKKNAIIFSIIADILSQLLTQINPIDVFAICIDGAVPMGKIQQQKQRRYTSALSTVEGQGYDSNSITPGTSFMFALDKFLKKEINILNTKFPVTKIIYSSHSVPGEGEHKIFDYFRQNTIDQSNEGAHVIYGMDADLIILSMISDVENLYMARDSINLELTNPLKKTALKLNDKGQPFRFSPDNIDIGILRDTLNNLMKSSNGYKDFAVFITLVGNDFLPEVPTMSSMEIAITTMIDVYVKLGKKLMSDDGEIIWRNFTLFLRELIKSEEYRIEIVNDEILNQTAYKKRTESRMMILARGQDGKINYEKFRNSWYDNGLGPKNSNIAQLLDFTDFSIDDVGNMCLQFAKGINWTLRYYTKGTDAVTNLWYYPYRYSPLIPDLVTMIEGLDSYNYFDSAPIEGEIRFGMLQQMVAVLPPYSKKYVPKEIMFLFESNSPIADIMPLGFVVERDAIIKEHKAVSMVPFADYTRIMNEVSKIRLKSKARDIFRDKKKEVLYETRYTNDQSKKYEKGQDIIVKKTRDQIGTILLRTTREKQKQKLIERKEAYKTKIPSDRKGPAWINVKTEWSELPMLI